MVIKNLPWTAHWLAGAGYAGHLVRDLANTHLMIVGGGTLLATGLCWYVLPRIVGRPLASEGLAQCAFWFTALGLSVFYVAFVANGIAIGLRVSDGMPYEAAKASMGQWYKVPVGAGAGVMGLGYWCLAACVAITIFQARLVRVPKPSWHLWKFIAAGVGALTVGTVQGVIQVQPKNADWLFRAGHAGEWIDPISHAHINLVTGLTMLVAGVLFALAPRLGGTAPSRAAAGRCFWLLLVASLSFYGVCLYLGLHEGSLVIGRGLTPEQAEEATPLHPYLLMAAGIAMMAAFWLLLVTVWRTFRGAPAPLRWFVLAGCGALAVGTLQGPIQAFPAVHDLLDKGGYAGDVIVNLHAQLNMLGGLMVLLGRRGARAAGGEGRPDLGARAADRARRHRRRRGRLLPRGRRLLGGAGVCGRRRQIVPGCGRRARALECFGARSRRGRRTRRLLRLRTRGLGCDGCGPSLRAALARGAAGSFRRAHSETRPAEETRRRGRLRAADGDHGVSGSGVAFRGLPARGLDSAHRRDRRWRGP